MLFNKLTSQSYFHKQHNVWAGHKCSEKCCGSIKHRETEWNNQPSFFQHVTRPGLVGLLLTDYSSRTGAGSLALRHRSARGPHPPWEENKREPGYLPVFQSVAIFTVTGKLHLTWTYMYKWGILNYTLLFYSTLWPPPEKTEEVVAPDSLGLSKPLLLSQYTKKESM